MDQMRVFFNGETHELDRDFLRQSLNTNRSLYLIYLAIKITTYYGRIIYTRENFSLGKFTIFLLPKIIFLMNTQEHSRSIMVKI